MDLNKYIITPDGDKPFHSSAYAKVANGGHVGSAGTTSFSQRRQIEGARQVVGTYARSMVHQVPREARTNVTVPLRDDSARIRGALPARTAPPRTGFVEPTSRTRNPFA